MLSNFYDKLETWLHSDDYKKHLNKEKNMLVELDAFLSKFTLKHINSMPIEEYVIGRENSESFCYYIEKRLSSFGKLSGRTNAYQKFVIQWSKKDNAYKFGDKRTKYRKNFGTNVKAIYINVRNALIDLITSSYNQDYDRIAKNPLNPQVKNKIAYLYDVTHQVPIYSDDDLNVILTIFDIPFNKNEQRESKRKKLFEFYNNEGLASKISTYMFMSFIYGWYGYRTILRSNERPTIEEKSIREYSLIDVDINTIFEAKRIGTGNKKRVVYNSSSEESRRITGKKAELIVMEYLEYHKKELMIDTIECWCSGENQDDGRGYDISCILKDKSEIYIEVKGIKSDLKDQVYFEMSANEYSAMKAHPNNYYIYFVNNVNNGKVIKRILAKDIYGEEPIKYRIHFEGKKKSKMYEDVPKK